MTIHHAVAKRAKENDIELSEKEDGVKSVFLAYDKPNKHTVRSSSAKHSLDVALFNRRFAKEFPNITASINLDQRGKEVGLVSHSGLDRPLTTFSLVDWDTDDVFASAMEEYVDTGLEEEDGIDEEQTSVIVAPEYKQQYRERGNLNHCGDWLAELLARECTVMVGKRERFSVETFQSIIRENKVDETGAWAKLPASGQPGWQGRYRMNGRQKLAVKIAQTGQLLISGSHAVVPRDWLEDMWDKNSDHQVAYELFTGKEVL